MSRDRNPATCVNSPVNITTGKFNLLPPLTNSAVKSPNDRNPILPATFTEAMIVSPVAKDRGTSNMPATGDVRISKPQ